MNDFLKNDLEIGDTVVYAGTTNRGSSDLVVARIKNFTPKKVTIESDKFWKGHSTVEPHKLIRIFYRNNEKIN